MTAKRRIRQPTLGSVYAQLMSDARRGIRRCDRYQDGEPCPRVATQERWDGPRRYSHPFCDTHAAEWDTTPVEDR